MVVIALQSHDLHRDQAPGLHGLGKVAPRRLSSPKTFMTPLHPDPISSIPNVADQSAAHLVSLNDAQPGEREVPGGAEREEPEAGPSQPWQHAKDIPLPHPRRHRSGVLMSRSRASSTGTSFKSSMEMSKSYGDLVSLASSSRRASDEMEAGEDTAGGRRSRRSRSSSQENNPRRIFSEGSRRGSSEDNAYYDNSARFYHHLHSRPASRQGSRTTSPQQSPGSSPPHERSARNSPIFSRRLTLPPSNLAANPGAGLSASLSPNHQFLQQHLPPTFPLTRSSPEGQAERSLVGSPMVILTPTTQDWKELKMLSRLEGEDFRSHDGSDYDDDMENLRDELSASDIEGDDKFSTSSSLLLTGNIRQPSSGNVERPHLHPTVSAEIVGAEKTHTPDPGSPPLASINLERGTPEKPVFKPVITAPSPIMPNELAIPSYDAGRRAVDGAAETPLTGDDDVIMTPDQDSPVRFVSFGRRDSLRSVNKPGHAAAAKVKSKRELQREQMFKMMDAELEADADQLGSPSSDDGWGVQQFGKGGRLEQTSPTEFASPVVPSVSQTMDRPGTAEARSDTAKDENMQVDEVVRNPKRNSLPLPPKPHSVSPSQPIKPSPLHASPVVAGETLDPSPEASRSASPSPHPSGTTTPSGGHTANLETIRDYARALSTHHSSAAAALATGPKRPRTPKLSNGPTSPRSPRRRDTSRISLVAGRLVQPFTVPPSTALPPSSTELRPSLSRNPSLQSFSPFRSPGLSAKGSPAAPPFPRLESTISFAPSTGAPSEPGTPTSETAGGVGGRGIDDYVILKEAGKGAYGLVMRAKVKGPKGEPVGEEVIIKYIIKGRILADCWKKHRTLGPIPVEIHVMDQLRHLLYHRPARPLPWDPARSHPGQPSKTLPAETPRRGSLAPSIGPGTPDSNTSSPASISSAVFSPTQKYIASEMKSSPERGHPNICKLLDFFEDREFYYLVMPRFGTGLDLFDRVESSPAGLEPFEIRSLLGQLADAVRFLHVNGIVHRDIKDENVILDGEGRCQLIDFGSAAHWRPGKKWDTFSGTLHYASPEILRGEMYGGKEQDVWALGVVGYVLLCGETPFSDLPDDVLEGLQPDGRAEAALHARCGGHHVDEGREDDGGGRLEDAADLIRCCLEMNAADRPTAEAMCEHRFLVGEGGWIGRKGWVGRKLG